MWSLDGSHHLLVALAFREAPERCGGAARLAVPGDARLEPPFDLAPGPLRAPPRCPRRGRSGRGSRRRPGGSPGSRGPSSGSGDRRLERRDVVVREVADDRQPERLRLARTSTSRDPAPIHECRPSRPRSTDSSRKLARPHPAQAEVGPEGSEEVGRDRRDAGHSSPETKETSVGGLEAKRVVCSSSAHAPASPVAPPPAQGASGSHRAQPSAVWRRRPQGSG